MCTLIDYSHVFLYLLLLSCLSIITKDSVFLLRLIMLAYMYALVFFRKNKENIQKNNVILNPVPCARWIARDAPKKGVEEKDFPLAFFLHICKKSRKLPHYQTLVCGRGKLPCVYVSICVQLILFWLCTTIVPVIVFQKRFHIKFPLFCSLVFFFTNSLSKSLRTYLGRDSFSVSNLKKTTFKQSDLGCYKPTLLH